jgi:hypothetical protein
MRRLIALEITLVICAMNVLVPLPAAADSTTKRCGKTGRCYVIAKKNPTPPSEEERTTAPDSPDERQDSQNDQLKVRKKFSAAYAEFVHRLDRYNKCVATSANCGTMPTAPADLGADRFSGPGNQPITAGQAAAIAVARLQLPTIAPGIGPSPDLNPWNMAAVGYPLWLWADGPTHVGPISDSVAGLSVSLDAKVSSLTFRMGDGHTVTCPGSGHPWTSAVEPGTKSPTCGYSYAKPSLPDGTYAVTAIANWAVRWTSNGQSGVINVPVANTTELPVGELQVLIR